VLRIALAGGRSLEVSPLHPAADGKPLGELHAGDLLDGARVRGVKLVPYARQATYDILPDSDSGTYFAAGTLIGSTLFVERPRNSSQNFLLVRP
jgi:hypothetical protein